MLHPGVTTSTEAVPVPHDLLAADAPAAARRVLCVFPKYAPSFGTFEYAYGLTDKAKAFMPPQGLLIIAAALPAGWSVRFVDENMERASEADFAWADVVFVSGMHIQRRQMQDICRRAHAQDKTVVLGGPSVSSCPDYYPDFDYLHLGELGDATEALFATLGRDCTRPAAQVRFKTAERRPLGAFPMPAYELAKIDSYFLGTIQFSSGCPYTCEFCDIPGLYGRVPRLKTPAQIKAELDKLLALGLIGSIYFVDDNLVANRRALKELLPHLVEWQKANGYAFSFACEATLNIARYPDILAMMRDAAFESIFCGIETPEPKALIAIDKGQNNQLPILDGVRIINAHGMQVVSGIILGLDTDTEETGDKLIDFIERSQIPMLTINLLQALPQTPLWTRLEKAGRLVHDDALESNVRFELPYDTVLKMWRECMERAYRPKILLDRYRHQMKAVWPNRLKRPMSRQRVSPRTIKKALSILARVIWFVGIRGHYKREFWRFALPFILRGDLEALFFCVLPAHHLIRFASDATSGRSNASHYSAKLGPTAAQTVEA